MDSHAIRSLPGSRSPRAILTTGTLLSKLRCGRSLIGRERDRPCGAGVSLQGCGLARGRALLPVHLDLGEAQVIGAAELHAHEAPGHALLVEVLFQRRTLDGHDRRPRRAVV
jgi:hypothetical protein